MSSGSDCDNLPAAGCESCVSRDECSEIYVRMGRSHAGPMGLKAFLGFLVPVGLFIAGSWALFSGLDGRAGAWAEFFAFLGGVGAVAVYLAAVWLIRKSGKRVNDGSTGPESTDSQAGDA